jgi:hypothetical protein
MHQHAEPLELPLTYDEPNTTAPPPNVVSLDDVRRRHAGETATTLAEDAHTLIRQAVATLRALQAAGVVTVAPTITAAGRLLDDLDDAHEAARIIAAGEPLAPAPDLHRPPTPRQVLRQRARVDGRPGGLPPARRCAGRRLDGQPCQSYALPWAERPLCRAHANPEERSHTARERAAWEARLDEERRRLTELDEAR